MDRRTLPNVEHQNSSVIFSSSGFKIQWTHHQSFSHASSSFASVGQVGMGLGISPNLQNSWDNSTKLISPNSYMRYVSMPVDWVPELPKEKTDDIREEEEEERGLLKRNKRGGLKLKIKIENPLLRRLISGAIAGVVSRTAVAPLETIRTLLMVGNCGLCTSQVFQSIIETEGLTGFYRGNLVNVIRVAPSKAIELFAYDTVNKHLTPQPGQEIKMQIPASLIAGAVAGFSSTLCMYPLELLKTRLTVQRGVYKNFFDAFSKIVRDEGPAGLYRGLTPSLIGVVPYAAANYFVYDTLRKAYKKTFNKEEIGNFTTLLIGSAAAAMSSASTFPLELARKQIQAGAFSGIQYKNMLHALVSILERDGFEGLYRGLGPSCMKLVPAAGISFMCYEACKRILVENEKDV